MKELYSTIVILISQLVNSTSGKFTQISAQDKCGQFVYFKDDSPYDVSWNGEEGICEVKFANDGGDDNSICATAHEFSVECGFELRFTEGLGFIPIKTFTCVYNTSEVQFCSKKGRGINVEFFAISSTTSKVALTVKQTKPPVKQGNPFLSTGIAKLVISIFTLLGLTLTSGFVFVKRRSVLPCYAPDTTPSTTTTTTDGGASEKSGML